MQEYVINVPVHLDEDDIIGLIDRKLCRLPPFCIDSYETDQIVYNLALEGKLGEKAQLAAAKTGADC